MGMTPDELARAGDIAVQLALTELVRGLIAEVTFTDDHARFVARLSALEQSAVDGLTERVPFPGAGDEITAYVREAASGFVTRLFASIRHPSENAGGNGT